MRTIFLPIQNRQQARNILRNPSFEKFVKTPDLRIVLFVAPYKIEQYKKEFGRKNVIIEGTKEIPNYFSGIDNFFGRLSYFYVDTKLVRHNRWRFILCMKKDKLRYWISIIGITIFGNIKPLRKFAKFLDRIMVRERHYGELFEKYRPDLVFAPQIASKIDRAFIRQAKDRNILSVGMINSWDTIGFAKYPIRILTDKLFTHNEIIKNDAVKYLDMKKENVLIVGMPHFDHYITNKRCSREEFFKRIGLNPEKRLILLAPFMDTAWQIAQIIQDAIESNEIPRDTQLLIRQHPAKDMEMGDLKLKKDVSVTEKPITYIESHGIRYSDVEKRDMEHLADTLFHSDVTINTCSTMSIDAAVFDKPVINIVFDGYEKKPYYDSVRQFYDETRVHYIPILKSGGVRSANNKEELIKHINMYLENHDLDKDGRKKIIEEQCWKLDGKSGERIFNYLLEFTKHEKQ